MRTLLNGPCASSIWMRGVAALILGLWLISPTSYVRASADTDQEAVIEQTVLASVRALYGGTSKVIAHVPLAEPFEAVSRWELVVTKETDLAEEDQEEPAPDPNPITICFVHNQNPECAERTLFPIADAYTDVKGRLFHQFRGARVVYAAAHRMAPLLMITACSQSGANGNCGIYTLLFRYDRSGDRFHLTFHDAVPRNNNGATRFMEEGPLQGDVVSATPTGNAPYAYFVSVFCPDPTGGYTRILRYRSKTHYNDGNKLSVVDSDMPELLGRLGIWKASDPLPTPSVLPRDCTKLVLRNGEEWCQ